MCVLSLIRSSQASRLSISAFRYVVPQPLLTKVTLPPLTSQLRQLMTSKVLAGEEHERRFHITPSRYSWNKYKDMAHFYAFLGLIPGFLIIFIVNVFVGPPTLRPIPPGYTPQEYEYHRHPITRFMVHYFMTSHQEDYERNLFYTDENREIRKMKLLDRRVKDLMAYRGDYPNYFVAPTIMGRYYRQSIASADKYSENQGASLQSNEPAD